MPQRIRQATSVLLCGGLAALAAVTVAGSDAPAAGAPTDTLVLKELNQGSRFVHIRNTKPRSRRANSTADSFVLTYPVADASGARIGTSRAACTTTVGARDFMKSTITCIGVMTLRDGTLTLQGDIDASSPTSTAAVTGGTGAYANARGVIVSRQTTTGAEDTITLAR